ncbi:hypothetical protein PGN35_015185 [Nodosilinea sp. PGN35]|uniref:hypothetical protein n=1 Tax=Nodosilinea sp. PGN35 TaxID=3020489 RepID=UPI0023B30251|nr:hypothetical protein [Nodosilinea sp. TSF1-S3]MDF0369883.1 hypothetical protein [Nodosilinea sp. TSF1-S3]
MSLYSAERIVKEFDQISSHPLNKKILNVQGFGAYHPDSEILQSLRNILPLDLRDSTVFSINGGILERFPPYDESFLVQSGIIFAAYVRYRFLIRLPRIHYDAAIASGGQCPEGNEALTLEPDWINIDCMESGNQQQWIRVAYEYAADLAQRPIPIMIVVHCPSCGQKLRSPSNLGSLTVKCPKCNQQWLWKPDSAS